MRVYAPVGVMQVVGVIGQCVLLLIYINDLPKYASCRIRMYADDTKCFSTINCLADAFQKNIDKLMSWSSDWQLSLNASK